MTGFNSLLIPYRLIGRLSRGICSIMTILKTAEISSASKRRLKYLHKAALVVVDEVGFMPL